MSKIVEVINDILEFICGEKSEPKRARTEMGRFVADDKSTKDIMRHGKVVKHQRRRINE